MKILTPVEIQKYLHPISYSDKIVAFGSCFADEIGGQLKAHGFDVQVNPFGTLYNVYSVYNSLMLLENPRLFTKDDVFLRPDGRLVTWWHHSRYGEKIAAVPTEEDIQRYLDKINSQLHVQKEFFANANIVIITLGTSYLFRHKQSGMVVSNCHKMPSGIFSREYVHSQECMQLLRKLTDTFSSKRFIFTVSPIRHMADGAHGNQLSKSTLLLAVQRLMQGTPTQLPQEASMGNGILQQTGNLYYFPAYEIMMDELRDYRWYAEDMVHPSTAAVKYIFERFKDTCIAPQGYSRMTEEIKKFKAAGHTAKIIEKRT